MASWRYEIFLLVLRNISLVRFVLLLDSFEH